ncbi:MAG: hypothetical protein OEU50_14305 [Gammaproteobacteria bacterium]|nr:hypothetical protein [Gammaproteobacteria bacterium]
MARDTLGCIVVPAGVPDMPDSPAAQTGLRRFPPCGNSSFSICWDFGLVYAVFCREDKKLLFISDLGKSGAGFIVYRFFGQGLGVE